MKRQNNKFTNNSASQPARKSHCRPRMSESGRQTKGGALYLADRTLHKHGSFLSVTEDEIYFRWLHRNQKTREIARNLSVPREAVEDVCQKRSQQMHGKRVNAAEAK